MARLVGGDLLDIGIECRIETSGGEISLGELAQALAIERVLEMLQGQGIVQNVSWNQKSVKSRKFW